METLKTCNILRFSLMAFTLTMFVACNPNSAKNKKWKEPTDVLFELKAEQDKSSKTNLSEGEVYFKSGTITLSNLTFEGLREQGEKNIDFSQTIPDNLDFSNGASKSIFLENQIPQGTYTKMNFELTISSIVLDGYISTKNNGLMPLHLEIAKTSYVSAQAKNQQNGSTTITLEANTPTEAKLILNISSWFKNISAQKWNNADYQNTNNQGQPEYKINISSSENSDIYLNLLNEIENSLSITF